jgi:hypothetical protein
MPCIQCLVCKATFVDLELWLVCWVWRYRVIQRGVNHCLACKRAYPIDVELAKILHVAASLPWLLVVSHWVFCGSQRSSSSTQYIMAARSTNSQSINRPVHVWGCILSKPCGGGDTS